MPKRFDAGLAIFQAMQRVQAGEHPAVVANALVQSMPTSVHLYRARKKIKAMELWALGGMTVAEVAVATGLHTSTVYRLTKKMRTS